MNYKLKYMKELQIHNCGVDKIRSKKQFTDNKWYKCGHKCCIKYVLETLGWKKYNYKSQKMLEHICSLGELDSLKYLFSIGYTTKHVEKSKGFHLACKYNRIKIVQFLINQGYDKELIREDIIREIFNNSCNDIIKYFHEILKIDKDLIKRYDCLKYVIYNRNIRILNYLKKEKLVNKEDISDINLIRILITYNNIDMIEYIIDNFDYDVLELGELYNEVLFTNLNRSGIINMICRKMYENIPIEDNIFI